MINAIQLLLHVSLSYMYYSVQYCNRQREDNYYNYLHDPQASVRDQLKMRWYSYCWLFLFPLIVRELLVVNFQICLRTWQVFVLHYLFSRYYNNNAVVLKICRDHNSHNSHGKSCLQIVLVSQLELHPLVYQGSISSRREQLQGRIVVRFL